MKDEAIKVFPVLSVRSWRALRRQFHQKIPTVVDGGYLATSLSMDARSAKNNILPSLKTIGLIGEDGRPKDLAKRWRDDTEYAQVCKEMLESVYPRSLLEAAPDPSQKREDVKRWFMTQTGAGDSAANKMTSIFTLLQKADVEDLKNEEASKKPSETKVVKRAKPLDKKNVDRGLDASKEGNEVINQFPEIHINVQVHVAADSTAEQVDHLFASIAKHLKEFSIRKTK